MEEDGYYKELVASLIGGSLEICYHEDDGTEGEYWYLRGGSGECIESFYSREEAIKEYNKLEKMIDSEIERRESISQAAAALGRMTSARKKKTSAENGKKARPVLVHVVLYDSPDQKTGTGVTPENPVTHQKASWIIRKSKYGGYTFRCTDQIDGTQCECH